MSLKRRDFLMLSGLGATGLGVSRVTRARAAKGTPAPAGAGSFRTGDSLRVQPVLVYELYGRREAASWRPWGGLHSREDAAAEKERIGRELERMAVRADFPLEVMPPAEVTGAEQAGSFAAGEFDVLLIYAASGERAWLESLAGCGRPSVMFLRHRSGPVYLWYEIAHPRFLRKTDDGIAEPNMGVEDIVVDSQDDILWRMRALYGLKNTLGTRILCLGGAGGWGRGGREAPQRAAEIWNLEMIDYPYGELEPRLASAMNDRAMMSEARKRAGEYLSGPGVSLATDRHFVDNAFLLYGVLRELMLEHDAPAFTIRGCMRTIMPISRTTACLPLSLLNDEGLLAFCESDFVVIPSGILLRYISGRPSFLQDPTHPHHGVVTLAHCTAPRRMDGEELEPAEVVTHFESDYGATPKVLMRKGQKITNIAPDFASRKYIGFRGEIIDHPSYDICRSQIDVRIEGDWRALLREMQGFHWVCCYGDYLRETGYALGRVGIEWRDVSGGEAVV